MKGNYWRKLWGFTSFGESHGPAIGLVMEDIKPGIDFPLADIQAALDKRKPGKGEFASNRREDDQLVVLSGVFEGKTTGMPICMLVYNKDLRSQDYENIRKVFRPGHGDYSLYKKFKIYDYRGGGRISGRETIARVAAGLLVSKMIEPVLIELYPVSIGSISVDEVDYDFLYENELYWPCRKTFGELVDYLKQIKQKGNSVGGIVQAEIRNHLEGLGDPVFEKLDANLSKAIMSIGGVKGIEFGDGFQLGRMKGSEANELRTSPRGESKDKQGGIFGGISAGRTISFRFAVKPTPSIALPQNAINDKGKSADLSLKGRFDTCLIPRIIPVAEAMIKLVLADAVSYQKLLNGEETDLESLREAVDKVDEDILFALARRKTIVEKIMFLKQKEGYSAYHPEREAAIVDLLISKGKELTLAPELINELWRVIFEFNRGKKSDH